MPEVKISISKKDVIRITAVNASGRMSISNLCELVCAQYFIGFSHRKFIYSLLFLWGALCLQYIINHLLKGYLS